ncbi:MAG: hypothetical protein JXB88_00845 [Spirochaetales bacterium]|nr:hypothetical protein [Spirochaetales bacterium]
MITDIEKTVKDIIKKSIDVKIPIDEIGTEDDLLNVGLTSRNFLKLVVGIETEWGFEFDDEFLNFNKLRTLKDISAYIEKRVDKN